MYIRIILVIILIWLLIRMFSQYLRSGNQSNQNNTDPGNGRKVSKDTGEYIDFEEVDD